MPATKDGKVAVILSGGGANGGYEIGVMKALFSGACPLTGHRPLAADIFTGTSVGSYNAAFMVSQSELESPSVVARLEDIWINKVAHSRGTPNGVFRFRGPLSLLDVQSLAAHPLKPFEELAEDSAFFAKDWFRRGVNFFRSSGNLERRTLELVDLSALISTEPLKQLVKETIELSKIRQSHKILRVVATSWKTGTWHAFSNEAMTDEMGHEAILASTAIPGLFPPVRIAGDTYVDGGLVMNTPLLPAIDAGADTIHLIYLDPDVSKIALERLQNTLDTMDRMLVIQFAIRVNEDIATAAWINRGLEVIERVGRGEVPSDADMRAFSQVAGEIEAHMKQSAPYKKLTIHRYHPREDLGGVLGLLNFEQDRIRGLIERGFKDAVEHDCQASGCVVPG